MSYLHFHRVGSDTGLSYMRMGYDLSPLTISSSMDEHKFTVLKIFRHARYVGRLENRKKALNVGDNYDEMGIRLYHCTKSNISCITDWVFLISSLTATVEDSPRSNTTS